MGGTHTPGEHTGLLVLRLGPPRAGPRLGRQWSRYLGQEHRGHQAQLLRVLDAVTGQAQAAGGRHLSQDSSAEELELLGAGGRAEGGLQQLHARLLQPAGQRAGGACVSAGTASAAARGPGGSRSPPAVLRGRDDEEEPPQGIERVGPPVLPPQQRTDAGAEPPQLLVPDLPKPRDGTEARDTAPAGAAQRLSGWGPAPLSNVEKPRVPEEGASQYQPSPRADQAPAWALGPPCPAGAHPQPHDSQPRDQDPGQSDGGLEAQRGERFSLK